MSFNHEKASRLYQKAAQIEDDINELRSEMSDMVDDAKSAPEMAEVFILLKNSREVMDKALKDVTKLRDTVSYKLLPEMMSDDGMTSFVTNTGYRVSVSNRFSASFVDKESGYDWLRENDLGDIIVETVNSQTLSATIRRMMEDEGIEPPEEAIKTSIAPYTSVTKVQKG